jgi:hypothetical protein
VGFYLVDIGLPDVSTIASRSGTSSGVFKKSCSVIITTFLMKETYQRVHFPKGETEIPGGNSQLFLISLPIILVSKVKDMLVA